MTVFRGLIFLCAVPWACSFILNDVWKDLGDCDHYDHDDDDHCPFLSHVSRVCGSDGITYKDYCAFMRVRCASKHNQIHVVGLHSCYSHTTPKPHAAQVTSTPMPTSTATPKTREPITTTQQPVISTETRVTSTVMPVTSTVMPVTSTVMPVTSTVMPVTSTVMPVTSTVMPVTSTVMPVTSTNEVSVENVQDFLCIELSREDCVPELNLVCGSDGFTYRNYCEFQKARCMHRKLKMVQSGSC